MTHDVAVISIADRGLRDRAARWLGRAGVRLPTFAELADPAHIPEARRPALRSGQPDALAPPTLFRMHWYNDRSRAGFAGVPCHLVFPPALTGVRAPIVMVLGCFFPMMGGHKMLAAYGSLGRSSAAVRGD